MGETNEEKLKNKFKINMIIICVLAVLLLISIIVLIVSISSKGVTRENNLSNLGMTCRRRWIYILL